MQRFNNILFIASNTEADKEAFSRAVTLAQKNQARLTLIAVVKPMPRPHWKLTSAMPPGRMEELQELMTEEHRKALEQLVAEAGNDKLKPSIEVLTGTPFIEIIRHVKRQGHDLAIKAASSEAGALAQLFGSTDLHLL